MVWTVIQSYTKQAAIVIMLALVVAVIYLVTNTINLRNQCQTKNNEIAMLKASLEHPNVIKKPVNSIRITQKKTVKKNQPTYVDIPEDANMDIVEYVDVPESYVSEDVMDSELGVDENKTIESDGTEYVEITERIVEYINDSGSEIVNPFPREVITGQQEEHRVAVGPMVIKEGNEYKAGIKAQINLGSRYVIGVGGSSDLLSAELLYRFK